MREGCLPNKLKYFSKRERGFCFVLFSGVCLLAYVKRTSGSVLSTKRENHTVSGAQRGVGECWHLHAPVAAVREIRQGLVWIAHYGPAPFSKTLSSVSGGLVSLSACIML